MTRWTVDVPEDLDRQVQDQLAKQDEDLSSYVNETIRRRLLKQTINEIRQRNKDLTPDEAQALADEAVDWARANRP